MFYGPGGFGWGKGAAWGPPWGPWWESRHRGRHRGPWARFFEAGEVRLALLSLLEEGPKHGYQLMKELEERSGGLYHASAGAIYPTLQQLEDEGALTSNQAEGKKVYQLTEIGKKELAENAEAVKRIWQRAKGWGDWAPWMGPEAMAVFKPAAQVMKAAMRAATHGGGEPDRISRIQQILQAARQQLDELT
jgi:DNA-binding PadR family transcriptional regulator